MENATADNVKKNMTKKERTWTHYLIGTGLSHFMHSLAGVYGFLYLINLPSLLPYRIGFLIGFFLLTQLAAFVAPSYTILEKKTNPENSGPIIHDGSHCSDLNCPYHIEAIALNHKKVKREESHEN